MLSRAATSLTLLGRQLERADYLARVLDVHVDLSLDRSDEPGTGFWTSVMSVAGWNGSDVDRREQAIELLVAGAAGPSVQRSVAAARAAAQAVRPSLPSELYEQLNTLHWRVQEAGWEGDLHGFLMRVELGVYLLDGLVEDTMFRDEAREFVRLGKFLERMDNVLTLVVKKAAELRDEPDAYLEWTAVLKCAFAFETYRLRFSSAVTGEPVLSYLLFDPALPRSAAFSAGEALLSVRRIDGERVRSAPARVLARLNGLFLDPSAAAGGLDDVERLAADYRDLSLQLTAALRTSYFQPGKVSATVPGDPTSRAPQQ
jgi:uncharacterized alpha-E superfamily protein